MTRKFRMLPLPTQAALRCREPAFRRFLAERARCAGIAMFDLDMAAEDVRTLCGVASRAELATNRAAGERWAELNSAYELWRDHPDLGEA